MNTIYDLRLFTPNGIRIGTLNNAIEFEYGRQKNNIGVCSILLPGEYYQDVTFTKDSLLEIWRYDTTRNIFQLVSGTLWFLRSIRYTYSGQVENIELLFEDSITLLNRRIIAWFAVDPIDSGILQYPSNFNQALDDILKMIFFHNYGPGAANPLLNTKAPVLPSSATIPVSVDPILRMKNISQDVYQSRAPIARVEFAWRKMLEAMQDVVSVAESYNTSLWFDIVYTPGTDVNIGSLVFKTWTNLRGQDLTADIRFGPTEGNLDNIILVEDYTNEATFIFAIGEEDPPVEDGISEILNVPIYNFASGSNLPFYPIEDVIAASGDVAPKNLDLIESEGRAELARRSPVLTLTGDVLQVGQYLFFTHYNYGDLVTTSWKSANFPAEITKYDIKVDNATEDIRIPLESSKFLQIATEV